MWQVRYQWETWNKNQETQEDLPCDESGDGLSDRPKRRLHDQEILVSGRNILEENRTIDGLIAT